MFLKFVLAVYLVVKFVFHWNIRFSLTKKVSQMTALVTRIYVPVLLR
jgi:hypothetical protein